MTEKQADVSGTCLSSLQPPPLIQMGDIDITSVGDIYCQPVPSGRSSPTPTMVSGTHGVLRSPGPSRTPTFMSVEDILVPTANPGKGTQSPSTFHSDLSRGSSASSEPTMLTALLKSGTSAQPKSAATNSGTKVAAQNNVVQQVLVSGLLNSLVNQSPIPTPATFKKATNHVYPTATGSKTAPPIVTPAGTLAATVPPHGPIQIPRAVSLSAGFNPSVLLANPAHLTQQQVIAAASTGTILPPNALLPHVALPPYLTSIPAIYGNSLVQAPTCTADPSAAKHLSVSVPPAPVVPCIVPASEGIEENKPSPPKKPRLG